MAPDVLVAGEALVDFVPATTGPLADVASFTRRAGGAPANVAAGLAALGAPPLLWTRVGADPFGDHLVAALEERGVPTDLVVRDPDAATALAFVAHEDGDRSFTFYRDGTADTRMEPGRVADDRLAALDWVHVGGVTLADEPARTATLNLAERAAAAGCTVSVDPNYRPELWPAGGYAASIDRLLAAADVVVASPSDLRAAGLDGAPATLARAVVERGPHTAVLTLGADGALAHATADAPWGDGEADRRHGGHDVDVVDPTGAGDAFVAGAIAALRAGRSLDAALAVGSATGAEATTAAGGIPAMPDREAVQRRRTDT